jgi:hypothetical protein
MNDNQRNPHEQQVETYHDRREAKLRSRYQHDQGSDQENG